MSRPHVNLFSRRGFAAPGRSCFKTLAPGSALGVEEFSLGELLDEVEDLGLHAQRVLPSAVHQLEILEYGQNEMRHAQTLIARIPDHSLTVFDKGFLSAQILLGLSRRGDERHFLIPAKSNTKWEVVSGTPDDCVVRMKVSPQARAKAPELPETWTARAVRVVSANGRTRILLTSLMDGRRHKVEDLAECYRRRWEIETSYREIKQSMLGCELTLRSRSPDGVAQEIWGALIAYNLVRLEMAKAAIDARVAPTDLSFLQALHILQHELVWAAGMSPGKLPAHLARLRLQLQYAIVEKRRGRNCPRIVKARPAKYAVLHLKKDHN